MLIAISSGTVKIFKGANNVNLKECNSVLTLFFPGATQSSRPRERSVRDYERLVGPEIKSKYRMKDLRSAL